jgi:DNA invertase Pin-like site-specific DNA recombinase
MTKYQQPVPEPETQSPRLGFEAAGYARFSDEIQRESSIEDQVRECREEATRDGGFIRDANIFADRDVRGATEERPALDRLLKLVRSGKATFTDLYVADTSRLARNSSFALKLLKVRHTTGYIA